MNELVGLSYSPWTEKARWALDHHGVRYRLKEYVPLVQELALRHRVWRSTGRWAGRVTVPVLFTPEGETLTDSLTIARHADRVGTGPPLFEDDDAVEVWVRRSEIVLEAGRSLTLRAARDDVEARRESTPPPFPNWIKPAVAAIGVAYLSRKFGVPDRDPLEDERAIDEALETLRTALGARGGESVLQAGFGFADIAMAVSLQFVLPPDSRFVHIGRATRKTMTRENLARKFADLVEWRDRTYEARRGRSAAS